MGELFSEHFRYAINERFRDAFWDAVPGWINKPRRRTALHCTVPFDVQEMYDVVLLLRRKIWCSVKEHSDKTAKNVVYRTTQGQLLAATRPNDIHSSVISILP